MVNHNARSKCKPLVRHRDLLPGRWEGGVPYITRHPFCSSHLEVARFVSTAHQCGLSAGARPHRPPGSTRYPAL